MNRCVAGALSCSVLAVSRLIASDNWVRLNNIHGWNISYPALWEVYVMQAPGAGRKLPVRESDNVDFQGPRDCHQRKERCGIFQIFLDSVKADRQFDVTQYVESESQNSEVISKQAGQLDGMPAYFVNLPDGQRLVIAKYKNSIVRVSYGPSDHKPTDKTLEATFSRMLSTMKFKN